VLSLWAVVVAVEIGQDLLQLAPTEVRVAEVLDQVRLVVQAFRVKVTMVAAALIQPVVTLAVVAEPAHREATELILEAGPGVLESKLLFQESQRTMPAAVVVRVVVLLALGMVLAALEVAVMEEWAVVLLLKADWPIPVAAEAEVGLILTPSLVLLAVVVRV
jgi:hypothetical protein